ncbi:MAG: SPFH/Band 7/PHB domain protein, partial [Mycobacterium sp.]
DDDLPRPEDDSDEIADWFSTETDPAIVAAVAKAEAEARVEGVIGPELHQQS